MRHPAGTHHSTGRDALVRRPGVAERRVLLWAFAASAALHVAAVAVYPLFVGELRPAGIELPPTSATRPAQGIEVIQLVELTEPEEPKPPEKKPEPERVTPVVPSPTAVPVRPGEAAPAVSAGEPEMTPAERLRPHLEDARVWGPVDPAVTRLTVEQREELILAGRLEAWRDSVMAADEAARAANDWTVTDRNGKKWGISPGKLHLGDLTLPLPFSFAAPVGQRDQIRDRQWKWDEIQGQAARGVVRDSWKERAQAIRRRKDREREKVRARPDTSRVKR